MHCLSINEWVNRLASFQEQDFTPAQIDAFLREYNIRPATICPYLLFSCEHYTRNLIYKSDLFEVLAICWEIGQQTLPHDHAGSNCWMVTPIGRLRVQNFRVERDAATPSACRLTATTSFDMDAAHPACVEREEAVHQVSNLPEFGSRAVSVHIYSRPYSACEVYDLATGLCSTRTLCYWSEFGWLVNE